MKARRNDPKEIVYETTGEPSPAMLPMWLRWPAPRVPVDSHYKDPA